MAERPPQPPIPRGTYVMDAVIKTLWGVRRNRFYFVSDAIAADEEDLKDIADAFHTHISGQFVDLMPDLHKLLRFEIKYYKGVDGYIFANSTPAALNGQLTTPAPAGTGEGEDNDEDSEDILPDEVSLVIQLKTGIGGRANQGRRFITGLSEKIQYAGEVTPDFYPKVLALAAKIKAPFNITIAAGTESMLPAHWNRKANVMKPVTACYVVNAMGTRRDRRKSIPWERI